MRRNIRFTQHQKLAISSNPPMIILAGPGSGKTSVLCAKIAHDVNIRKLTAKALLAITFSASGVERILMLLPSLIGEKATDVKVMTIHRLSWQIIRNNPSFFLNAGKQETLRRLPSLTIAGPEDTRYAAAEILAEEERAFFNSPESFVEKADRGREEIWRYANSMREAIQGKDTIWEVVREITRNVEVSEEVRCAIALDERLARKGAFSLSALPTLAALFHLAQPEKAKEAGKHLEGIYYDEFQDTSEIDIAVISPFIQACNGKITIAGDPFQTIYAFRGALGGESFERAENLIEQITGKKPPYFFLPENHRNPDEIIATGVFLLNAAKQEYALTKAHVTLLEQMELELKQRFMKRTSLYEDEKDSIFIFKFASWKEELRWMAQTIRKILSTTNRQLAIAIIAPGKGTAKNEERSLEVEKALLENEISFYTPNRKNPFRNAPITKLLLAMLLIVTNQYDTTEIEEITHQIGKTSLWEDFISNDADLITLSPHEDILHQFTHFLERKHQQDASRLFQEMLTLREEVLQGKVRDASALLEKLMKTPSSSLTNLLRKSLQKTEDDEKGKKQIEEFLNLIERKAENFTAIAFAKWFQDTIRFALADPLSLEGDPAGKVAVIPLRATKGLEYDLVFWPTFNQPMPAKSPIENVFLTFTGITRPRTALILSYNEEDENILRSKRRNNSPTLTPERTIIQKKAPAIADSQAKKIVTFRKLLATILSDAQKGNEEAQDKGKEGNQPPRRISQSL
ncbi:MAG: ATP-dependent helicase [Candidatus Methanomethylicaceae archaeon]